MGNLSLGNLTEGRYRSLKSSEGGVFGYSKEG